MATASLSALALGRAASAGPSLFALRSSSRSAAASLASAGRRRWATSAPSLAFQQSNLASNRRPLATAFSSGGGPVPSSSIPTRGLSASASSVEGAKAEGKKAAKKKPIPTILLAGFLGSGKTTTLKHLLENNSNIKIGTIVNDVASVNIDAKLISNSGSSTMGELDDYAEGVVELQNGCACCSLADELMGSIVKLTRGGERELDAIVVELSGVADPVAVRDNWEQARLVRTVGTSWALQLQSI